MSTTPSMPERTGLSYAVVGGARLDRIQSAPLRASLLLLNRGPRFARPEALREAEALDVGEVISVERSSVEVDTLSREHPEVKFLLPHEAASVGELINIGVAEARGRLVIVLWSDMRVDSPAALAGRLDAAESSGALCVAPVLSGPDGSVLPVLALPRLLGGRLSVLRSPAVAEQTSTLYPIDYCGIYRKDRFLGIGGFEGPVSSAYWQKLEFGLRCHLWGESLVVRRDLRLAYCSDLAPEDTTPDPAYRRFYLRTVAVRVRNDGGYLPIARFLPYFLRAGTGLASALAEFGEARRWVDSRRKLFRRDLRGLVERWGKEA